MMDITNNTNSTNNEFTWEDVEKDFIKLVRYSSNRLYMSNTYIDPSISADDLFQIGMLKLFDCYTKYNHLDYETFKRVVRKSLKREIIHNCKMNKAQEDYENALLFVEAKPIYESTKELDTKLDELKHELKYENSTKVLEELINPSERTLSLVNENIDKKSKQVKNGKNTRIPRTNNVTNKHIRESLGLTRKQVDIALREIRSKAKDIFELEDSFFK